MERKRKISSFTIFLVYVQMALAVLTGIVFVLFLLNKVGIIVLQFCLGVTLIFMSFLSSRVYERSKFTILCLIFGVLLIILNILRLVGVV